MLKYFGIISFCFMSYLCFVVDVPVVFNLFDLQFIGVGKMYSNKKFCKIEFFSLLNYVELISLNWRRFVFRSILKQKKNMVEWNEVSGKNKTKTILINSTKCGVGSRKDLRGGVERSPRLIVAWLKSSFSSFSIFLILIYCICFYKKKKQSKSQ